MRAVLYPLLCVGIVAVAVGCRKPPAPAPGGSGTAPTPPSTPAPAPPVAQGGGGGQLQAPGAGSAVQNVRRRFDEAKAEQHLRQIGIAYKQFETTESRAPASQDEFAEQIKTYGEIYRAFKDGEYVIVPGIRNPGSNNVIAHEKEARSNGLRVVVMGDGSTKRMHTVDFNAAMKAQGK